MTDENEERLLKYYWEQFEEEIKQRGKFYDTTARMVITIPFFINAGAAVGLTSFYSCHDPLPNIKFATIWFICGAMLGVLALIFEFFFAYFSWTSFQQYLAHFKKHATTPKEILLELQKHYDSYFKGAKDTHATVLLRIINGAISIIFCFTGIYYITRFIIKNPYLPNIIFTIIALYAVTCIFWMRSKLKEDKANE